MKHEGIHRATTGTSRHRAAPACASDVLNLIGLATFIAASVVYLG